MTVAKPERRGTGRDLYIDSQGVAGHSRALLASGKTLGQVADKVDFVSASGSLSGSSVGRALSNAGDVLDKAFARHAKEAETFSGLLDRAVRLVSGAEKKNSAALREVI